MVECFNDYMLSQLEASEEELEKMLQSGFDDLEEYREYLADYEPSY